jgi:formate hydrogenlyase subunit 3/multisubunit Na+/H+ antiporter MnhD subunit
MNSAIAILLVCAGFGITFVPGRRVRAIRTVALSAAGLAFAVGVVGAAAPAWVPAWARADLASRDAWLLAVLTGSYFLTFVARGLAAKAETVASFFMMAAGVFAVAAPTLESFFVAVLALWVSGGVLLQLRGIEGKAMAFRAFGAAAVLSLALGLAAILLARHAKLASVSPSLLSFSLLCLLGAFPLHFWLPVALPSAPFLLATLVPVVFARVGAAGFVHFARIDTVAPVLCVLGLVGTCWCACAAFAADNLREKVTYLLCAQSSVCAWALGKGLAREVEVLLLVTAPAAVLLGIGVSILYDRFKYLDVHRLSGVAGHLPRMHFLLVVGTLGLVFLPGSASFLGLWLLLPHAQAAWEMWLLAAALLMLLGAGGHAYMCVSFGDGNDDLRRAGDLNLREMTAVIPLAACVLAGLWPGFAKVLKGLLAMGVIVVGLGGVVA